MSIVKSFSVNNGDMFYILHGNDNFTIIDCCLNDENEHVILNEITTKSKNKGIKRFISTHPDQDHISGIEKLDNKMNILNFYCVKNEATKQDETISFKKYCQLRDSKEKSYSVYRGCSRKWLNETDDERGKSGINFLWPILENSHFKQILESVKKGESPNNLSPIITYGSPGGKFMWMGDLETEFMTNIHEHINQEKVDVIFAPHHGRDSGKIPDELLNKFKPKVIIVGEAPSEHLHYYPDYNTITQNSAGDIIFDCQQDIIHIFTSKEYSVDFLEDTGQSQDGLFYLGSLKKEN